MDDRHSGQTARQIAVVVFDPVSLAVRHLSHPLAVATAEGGKLFPGNPLTDFLAPDLLRLLRLRGTCRAARLPGLPQPQDLHLVELAELSVLLLSPAGPEAEDPTYALTAALADVPPGLPPEQALSAALPALAAAMGASGAALRSGASARVGRTGGAEVGGAEMGALDQAAEATLVLRLSDRRDLALVLTRPAALPWTATDRQRAETLRAAVLARLLDHAEAALEESAAAEERNALVRAELSHRVKNVLALVKSILRQTASRAASVRDFAATLDGRLQALALAHDQSLASRGGQLSALIASETAPHGAGRITARGPELSLEPRAFGVVALVLHEMMTNAAKYGALSVPGGQLAIGWMLDDDGVFRLDWHETGGPAVTSPRRTGFGTRLIRSALEADLKGTADLQFAPEGLQARLTLPAGHTTPSSRP